MDTTDLIARLDAIDAKLDYVVSRQQFIEELVRDMTPVAREGLHHLALQMAGWEERGWFAMGNELVNLFDRLANAYGPDDVQELSEHVVQLVDTIRNVTQPDVLALANEATDVIHHADEVEPLGPLGMARAARDEDVQRGMAVALEVLRHVGRIKGGQAPAERRAAPPAAKQTKAPTPAKRPEPLVAREAELPSSCPAPAAEDLELVACVVWEGRRFTAEGYLVDGDQWDEDLARKMAAGLELELTDEHWMVVHWARNDFLTTSVAPNVRRMAVGSGVGTRRLYELFPGTPGKKVAMVAGISKPVGCL